MASSIPAAPQSMMDGVKRAKIKMEKKKEKKEERKGKNEKIAKFAPMASSIPAAPPPTTTTFIVGEEESHSFFSAYKYREGTFVICVPPSHPLFFLLLNALN